MGVDATGGQYGPSWWDVERAHEELEREFDCQVLYTATCTKTGKEGRYGWWIRATAHPPRKLNAAPRAVGAAAFRGNSGAKTYTAAMHLALLHLRFKLEEKEEGAEQASMF
jgi:hypothetical protein